jgi:hypothetical protein
MLDWPPKTSFEPPRYPNAWLYVSRAISPTYRDAILFVQNSLERYVGFEDSLAKNTSSESADGQRRVHHLQPVSGLPNPARDHYHDLHIRYYFGHLPPRNQHMASVEIDGQLHEFWRLATSVHYEPEPENRHHPYIDECPVCGVVAPYDIPGDRCETSHDPLGLELLFFGTIRGETILRSDGQPVGGLKDMAAAFEVRLTLLDPSAPDMNTHRIGVAMIMLRSSH